MHTKKKFTNAPVNIEVFIGGAPLLELRVVEGLLQFGESHPHWRFTLRGPNARYTPDWLQRQQVRGALILIDPHHTASALNAARIPWVQLMPPQPLRHNSVSVDDVAIGRMGADFFLRKGFRKFAFCDVGTPWSRLRGEGFEAALEAQQLTCARIKIPFDVATGWTLKPGSDRRLRRWLSGLDRVTAVMAAHDVLANRIVDLCRQEDMRVPEDVAVLGVGNHDLLCRLSPVPISSIDCAVPEVARRGASMLESLLAHPEQVRAESEVVAPLAVMARRSTDVLGFEHDLINHVVGYIHEHARTGLKARDLEHIFPVSQRTLSRRFNEYVGHTPGEEIRRTRLRQADIMLQNTHLPLEKIALACGYGDAAHLSRAYRAAYGKAPGARRRG